MNEHIHNTVSVELQNVSFGYGTDLVLENISFSLKEGEFVGIIGPNGGGKSTLLKLILGILKPQKGDIKIFGHGIDEAKKNIEITYLPQRIIETEGNFPATVEEIVISGRTRHVGFFHRFSAQDKQIAEESMCNLGILSLRDYNIANLSLGQRQRVLIARAFAAEPKILILDEPTVGVDAKTITDFFSLLSKIRKEKKITIILVSHDIDVVAKEVDSVFCINKKLVCRFSGENFDKKDYVQEIYGENMRYLNHNHEEN